MINCTIIERCSFDTLLITVNKNILQQKKFNLCGLSDSCSCLLRAKSMLFICVSACQSCLARLRCGVSTEEGRCPQGFLQFLHRQFTLQAVPFLTQVQRITSVYLFFITCQWISSSLVFFPQVHFTGSAVDTVASF